MEYNAKYKVGNVLYSFNGVPLGEIIEVCEITNDLRQNIEYDKSYIVIEFYKDRAISKHCYRDVKHLVLDIRQKRYDYAMADQPIANSKDALSKLPQGNNGEIFNFKLMKWVKPEIRSNASDNAMYYTFDANEKQFISALESPCSAKPSIDVAIDQAVAKCECGAHKTGSGAHSSWCPLDT